MIKFIFGFIFGFITIEIYKLINKNKLNLYIKKFIATFIYITFSFCILIITNYGNNEQYICLFILINLFNWGIYAINISINNENLFEKNDIKTIYYSSIFLFMIFNLWLKIDKGIISLLNVLFCILCSNIIPIPTIKDVLLDNNIYEKIIKYIKSNIDTDILYKNIKLLFMKMLICITNNSKQMLICFFDVILYVIVYIVLLKLNIEFKIYSNLVYGYIAGFIMYTGIYIGCKKIKK